MASYTPNLNLILPVGTEKVSRAIVNSNNTIIDGAIGGIINPSVESVGSLAELKTYLLSVVSSATARKNVYVQFNVTAASSPFSAGLYTGNLQKETNGSFSVLCHGNAGGVVEVQYNATNTTWTITNFNSEISALNGNIEDMKKSYVVDNIQYYYGTYTAASTDANVWAAIPHFISDLDTKGINTLFDIRLVKSGNYRFNGIIYAGKAYGAGLLYAPGGGPAWWKRDNNVDSFYNIQMTPI